MVIFLSIITVVAKHAQPTPLCAAVLPLCGLLCLFSNTRGFECPQEKYAELKQGRVLGFRQNGEHSHGQKQYLFSTIPLLTLEETGVN